MKQWRDVLTWLTGLGLIVYEAIFTSQARPALLVVYTGMIGLPLVLRADERKQGVEGPTTPEPPP